jgi:hypothetical protein
LRAALLVGTRVVERGASRAALSVVCSAWKWAASWVSSRAAPTVALRASSRAVPKVFASVWMWVAERGALWAAERVV